MNAKRIIDVRRVAKFCNEGMSCWDAKQTAEVQGVVTDGRFLIRSASYAKRVLKHLRTPKPQWTRGFADPKPLGDKQLDQAFKASKAIRCRLLEDCRSDRCADVWFYPPIVALIRKLFPTAQTWLDLKSKKLLFRNKRGKTVAVVMGNLDQSNEYYASIK